MFKRISKAFMEYQERRAAYIILTNLTDRDLRDMGLTRGEIRQRVYQTKD